METIHVALTFDDNYTEQSIVLMTSILHNKGDEKIHFHILDGGLSDNNKNKVFGIKNCKITFHLVNTKLFENYKQKDYYPVTILWSLILPEVVRVDKLIYFDCDIVVNSSLKELWNTDLEDSYIAAVEDANGKKYSRKFRLKPWTKFFNSGVMVINCKKWRENKISKQALEFAMQHTGTKLGLDQNVLNKLFEGEVKFLDLKWNLQYCPINIWATFSDSEEYKNAINNPAIIHFVGDFKPWKIGLGCFNPKQYEYFRYHKMTLYAFNNYRMWKNFDKLLFIRGIWAYIKRYPLFFMRKQFWNSLFTKFFH